jgi:hypothetical protein
MSNPEITIYDASTGTTEIREMTAEEHANFLEVTSATPIADADTGTSPE